MESQTMEKGTALIPFQLKNYTGNMLSSDDFSTKRLLLIVFTCNHCPYAKVSWPILTDLQKRYERDGLQVIAINPNNNPKYQEDRFEEMAPFVQREGLNFPYLFDEDQSLARAYKAVCTPDPFLFLSEDSSSSSLFYHGRLNDNWQEPEKVKEKSMELFILAGLRRGEAPKKTFPSMGCSIKWV